MNGEIKIVKEATERKAAEANRNNRNRWFMVMGLRKEKVILSYVF